MNYINLVVPNEVGPISQKGKIDIGHVGATSTKLLEEGKEEQWPEKKN